MHLVVHTSVPNIVLTTSASCQLLFVIFLFRFLEMLEMIQGGSRACYLQVVRHVYFLEVLADCLFKMTWMSLIFPVLLLLMMSILPIRKSGNFAALLLYFWSILLGN